MASFDLELGAVIAMGLEYRDLLVRTSGIGHNHGPSESDFDPSVFTRIAALPGLLSAAFVRMDSDHHAAWRAWLDDSTRRLHALAESRDPAASMARHVLERWEAWIAGKHVDDAPAWFGTAVELARDNARAIDKLLAVS